MRKLFEIGGIIAGLFEIGGIIAGLVLVIFGAAAIYMGVDGPRQPQAGADHFRRG